jgi:hypothetical protein
MALAPSGVVFLSVHCREHPPPTSNFPCPPTQPLAKRTVSSVRVRGSCNSTLHSGPVLVGQYTPGEGSEWAGRGQVFSYPRIPTVQTKHLGGASVTAPGSSPSLPFKTPMRYGLWEAPPPLPQAWPQSAQGRLWSLLDSGEGQL